MAAALFPLVAAAAPEIIKLIAGLVHKAAPVAEANNGPGTGPVKFADVFSAVVSALTSAANAGQIDKQLPPDETIKAIIQAVVSSMQLGGLLGAPVASASIAVPPAVALRAGQSVTITVLP